MSYGPTTDFLALLRETSNGVRTERMPGLDYIAAALSRAGFFNVSVSAVAPTTNQAGTAWFKPFVPSWLAEGTLFLWNVSTLQYEVATPALWAALFSVTSPEVVQDVVVAGPVNVQTNASVVRVMNVGASVTLVMPLSTTKLGSVLISDWANLAGTNNITIQRTAPDVFPNGLTSLTIAGDGGSFFLRPVPGGYTL